MELDRRALFISSRLAGLLTGQSTHKVLTQHFKDTLYVFISFRVMMPAQDEILTIGTARHQVGLFQWVWHCLSRLRIGPIRMKAYMILEHLGVVST